MTSIKIILDGEEFLAELYDTPTAHAIQSVLPLDSSIHTWGDEIYFGVDAHTPLEDEAKSEVGLGDLAYWPTMPAFCIFFGATPASYADEPRAASAVNVFGRLDQVDLNKLRALGEGVSVRVEIASHTS